MMDQFIEENRNNLADLNGSVEEVKKIDLRILRLFGVQITFIHFFRKFSIQILRTKRKLFTKIFVVAFSIAGEQEV